MAADRTSDLRVELGVIPLEARSELARFILARIRSEEGGARFHHEKYSEADIWWFTTHGTSFHLSDCAARRRLVHWLDRARTDPRVDGRMQRFADHALRLLALPYSDYPDFDHEWLV